MYLKKHVLILLFGICAVFMNYHHVWAQTHSNCYGYLTEMVRSSNFPIRDVGMNKINLLIDDDQPNMISAQIVYDVIPKQDQPKSFVSIGWIKYDIAHHILWNNSADLNEHPVQLTYNKKYANEFDQCSQR